MRASRMLLPSTLGTPQVRQGFSTGPQEMSPPGLAVLPGSSQAEVSWPTSILPEAQGCSKSGPCCPFSPTH